MTQLLRLRVIGGQIRLHRVLTDSLLDNLAGFAVSIVTWKQPTHKEKGGSSRVIRGFVALFGLLPTRNKAGNDITVVATQNIESDGDEGEVCTTSIERRVAMQHDRPPGVHLTPDGKQLPDRCDGGKELVLATVNLVAQEIWGAQLDMNSALSIAFDEGFVRTLCGLEVISREDGTDRSVGILG